MTISYLAICLSQRKKNLHMIRALDLTCLVLFLWSSPTLDSPQIKKHSLYFKLSLIVSG